MRHWVGVMIIQEILRFEFINLLLFQTEIQVQSGFSYPFGNLFFVQQLSQLHQSLLCSFSDINEIFH